MSDRSPPKAHGPAPGEILHGLSDAGRGATGGAQPSLGNVQLKGPAAWSEHLYYDLECVRRIAELWRTASFKNRADSLQSVVHDALLDSFAMRLRNVAEFFYDKAEHRPNIVRLNDYFGNAAKTDKWLAKHVTVEVKERLQDIWKAASEQVAHLTTERTHDSSRKEWDLEAALALVTSLMKAFLADVPNSNLSQNRDWASWR